MFIQNIAFSKSIHIFYCLKANDTTSGRIIIQWTKMPKGGHFAALEQPKLLIDDIRAFAQTLR